MRIDRIPDVWVGVAAGYSANESDRVDIEVALKGFLANPDATRLLWQRVYRLNHAFNLSKRGEQSQQQAIGSQSPPKTEILLHRPGGGGDGC